MYSYVTPKVIANAGRQIYWESFNEILWSLNMTETWS